MPPGPAHEIKLLNLHGQGLGAADHPALSSTACQSRCCSFGGARPVSRPREQADLLLATICLSHRARSTNCQIRVHKHQERLARFLASPMFTISSEVDVFAPHSLAKS
jgi:hypothetical protein